MTDRAPDDPPVPPRKRIPRFATLRVIAAATLREMEMQYGRSPGGYLWAVLEPLAMLIVISYGFSLIARSPPLGTNFFLFYATGLLPFNFFREAEQQAGAAIQMNRALLSYPRITWLDVVLARAVLVFVTQSVIFILVVGGILLVFDEQVQIDVPLILIASAAAGTLGVGIGMFNAFAMTRAPLYGRVWGILTAPLFLSSGLFYTVESLPQSAQAMLWWNPLCHVTGYARSAFYHGYEATFASPAYLSVWTLGALLLGMMALFRGHKQVLAG